MFDPYHKWLGIPKDKQPATHYQLLAIQPDERDPEVIEEAAIRQMAHVRGYQLGPHAEQCTKVLNEIAQAKATLLNPVKRQAYDASLAQTAAIRAAAPVASASASPQGITQEAPVRKRSAAVIGDAGDDADDDLPSRNRRGRTPPGRGSGFAVAVAAGIAGVVILATGLAAGLYFTMREVDAPRVAKAPAVKVEAAKDADERVVTREDKKPAANVAAPPRNDGPAAKTTTPPVQAAKKADSVVNPPVQETTKPKTPSATGRGPRLGGPGLFTQELFPKERWQLHAVSPDGRRALCSNSFEAIVVDVQQAKEIHRFRIFIRAAVFSADGKRFAISYTNDKTVRLFDTEDGKPGPVLQFEKPVWDGLAFSPDGRVLAVAANFDDRDFTHLTLFLWDTTTGKMLRRGVEDARFMHEVLFSTDGRFIYSRGSDHCVRRWSADTLEAVVLTKCDDVIRFTAGGRFALLSFGLQFTLWDLDKNAAVRTLTYPTLSGINGMTGSPDGRWVTSLHQDGGLHLWDTTAGKHLGELKLHTKYGPNQYLCAADGLQLVTGAEGDPLRYTRLEPERLQAQ